MVEMATQVVASSEPFEGGNYIERGLAEVEKEGSEKNYSFNKVNGAKYVLCLMLDLFFAGIFFPVPLPT